MMFGLTAIECFVAIFIIFTITYWITPRKIIWFPMVLTVVLLSVLAFHVIPNDSDDLSRYFMQLNYFRIYGHDYLQRCFDTGFNNWDTYRVCAYYFYFFRRFESNQWLPAVTIFIVYGLMFLIMYKAANHFKISKPYLYFGIIFFLCTYWYYDTYSGVRNGLTFAVIFACAYYHLVERKRIPLCYLGYFLACLTHSAGIMLVALVVLTELTLNNSGKFINFMLIFGLIVGGGIMQFLASKTDNKFVHIVAGQAEKHQADDTVLYTDTNFLVNISLLIVVAALLFYYSYFILTSIYKTDLKRLYKFSSIVMYFMLGCLFSELIFMRFARWILPIIGALFIMIGSQLQKEFTDERGMIYLKYYAPKNEMLRAKSKVLINFLNIVYTAIHFWYLLNGSSVHWMHF